jgi:hypothetical protein
MRKIITTCIKGDKVLISVSIKKPRTGWLPTVTGKNLMVATSCGWITLKNGMRLSMCLFKPREA